MHNSMTEMDREEISNPNFSITTDGSHNKVRHVTENAINPTPSHSFSHVSNHLIGLKHSATHNSNNQPSDSSAGPRHGHRQDVLETSFPSFTGRGLTKTHVTQETLVSWSVYSTEDIPAKTSLGSSSSDERSNAGPIFQLPHLELEHSGALIRGYTVVDFSIGDSTVSQGRFGGFILSQNQQNPSKEELNSVTFKETLISSLTLYTIDHSAKYGVASIRQEKYAESPLILPKSIVSEGDHDQTELSTNDSHFNSLTIESKNCSILLYNVSWPEIVQPVSLHIQEIVRDKYETHLAGSLRSLFETGSSNFNPLLDGLQIFGSTFQDTVISIRPTLTQINSEAVLRRTSFLQIAEWSSTLSYNSNLDIDVSEITAIIVRDANSFNVHPSSQAILRGDEINLELSVVSKPHEPENSHVPDVHTVSSRNPKGSLQHNSSDLIIHPSGTLIQEIPSSPFEISPGTAINLETTPEIFSISSVIVMSRLPGRFVTNADSLTYSGLLNVDVQEGSGADQLEKISSLIFLTSAMDSYTETSTAVVTTDQPSADSPTMIYNDKAWQLSNTTDDIFLIDRFPNASRGQPVVDATTVSTDVPGSDQSQPSTTETLSSLEKSSAGLTKVGSTSDILTGSFNTVSFTEYVVPVTDVLNTRATIGPGGEVSPKQMPNFNTTLIIASASAVLALVIVVLVLIFCLRRKKRTKPQPTGQYGDELWVDLYRSNPSHQMPLPSLTTAPSTFEMTEDLISAGSEHSDRNDNTKNSVEIPAVKSQKLVSSFQIKKTNQGEDKKSQYLESQNYLGIDLTGSWLGVSKSASLTSLPTTEVSYNPSVADFNHAATGHRFRAVYAYKPVCKGEMALKEGELIVCKERDRNGWMFGAKPRTQEEGWFPAVYVDEVSCEEDLELYSDIPDTYDLLESNKFQNKGQHWTGIEHKVCYSYESSIPGDLNLQPGQSVIVLQTLANGWWFAVSGDHCGWFPGSYVEMVVDDSFSEQSPNDAAQIPSKASSNLPQVQADMTSYIDPLSDNKMTLNTQLPGTIASVTETTQGNTAQLDPSATTQQLNLVPVSDPNTSTLLGTDHCKNQAAIIISPDPPVAEHSAQQGEDIKPRSLRPVRPAPPPPKRKNSGLKKTSANTSLDSLLSNTQAQPKPVLLIKGRRPKLHKVNRNQLDDKSLNPMLKPSKRGFIPKPGVITEKRLKYFRPYDHSTYKSILREATPSGASSFTQVAQSEGRSGRSSSKSSLDSGSDSRSGNSGSNIVSAHKYFNGKSNSSNAKHLRSPATFTSKERSLTPDSKREKSNSPKLLTTGNLLQNVQRFDGAIKQTSQVTLDNDYNGTLPADSLQQKNSHNGPPRTFQKSLQRIPTNVAPPKVPITNKFVGNHQQDKSVLSTFGKKRSVEATDSDTSSSRDNSFNTDSTKHPPTFVRSESAALNRESLVITPGIVSEIVHHINSQSPIQKDLSQRK